MAEDPPLSDEVVLAEIRRLWPTCQYDSQNVHGHLTHKGRRILRQDIWHVLKTGVVPGDTRRNGENTGWTYAVEGRDLDGRLLLVVVEFIEGGVLPDRLIQIRSAYLLEKEDQL